MTTGNDSGIYDLIDDVVAAGGRLVVDEAGQLRCQAAKRLIPLWSDRIRYYRDRLVEMFNRGGLDRALMEPHDLPVLEWSAADAIAWTISTAPVDVLGYRDELKHELDGVRDEIPPALVVEVEAYRRAAKWLREQHPNMVFAP